MIANVDSPDGMTISNTLIVTHAVFFKYIATFVHNSVAGRKKKIQTRIKTAMRDVNFALPRISIHLVHSSADLWRINKFLCARSWKFSIISRLKWKKKSFEMIWHSANWFHHASWIQTIHLHLFDSRLCRPHNSHKRLWCYKPKMKLTLVSIFLRTRVSSVFEPWVTIMHKETPTNVLQASAIRHAWWVQYRPRLHPSE